MTMDAVMYLKEKARMCGTEECAKCPAYIWNECELGTEEIFDPNKAVDFVEKWSKEHPIRTYLSDFLEKYPNAEKTCAEAPKACVKQLGYIDECPSCAPDYIGCSVCWNTPMEE